MSDVFDQLESQLRRAVRARRPPRPWWVRRGHRRMTALAVIITLITAGGALAAGGVIQIGSHTSHKGFRRSQRNQRTCEPPYVVDDCSEYRGRVGTSAVTTPTVANGSTSRSQAPLKRPSTPRSASSPGATTAGHLFSPTISPKLAASGASAMVMTSPVVSEGGPLPARYTCSGAVSPPLEWANVPANTGSLWLEIKSVDNSGPAMSWVVGDISPTAKGVAEGKTPEGGIVGANSEGRAAYGGICPRPGQSTTIQISLDALSKKIPLSPGFQPAEVEREHAGVTFLDTAVLIAVNKGPTK